MSFWIVGLLVYAGITLWVFVSNADRIVYGLMKVQDNLSNLNFDNQTDFGSIAVIVYKLSVVMFTAFFCVLLGLVHAMFWWTPILESISQKNYARS